MSTRLHNPHTVAANVGRQAVSLVSTLRRLAPLRGVSHPANRLIAATLRQSGAETLLEKTS